MHAQQIPGVFFWGRRSLPQALPTQPLRAGMFPCMSIWSVDIYLIASRSPPGQDPKLLSFLEFGITLEPLLPLWDAFWSHFCNPGITFGAPWLHFFDQKTVWGAKGATRGAKVKFPTKSSSIWTLFGSLFLKISSLLHEILMFFSVSFQGFVFVVFLRVFNKWKQSNRWKTLRRPSKTESAENQQEMV